MPETGVQRTVQDLDGRIFQGCLDAGIQKLRAGGEDNGIAVVNRFFDPFASFLRIAVRYIKGGGNLFCKSIFKIVPSQFMTVGPAGFFGGAVMDKGDFERTGR